MSTLALGAASAVAAWTSEGWRTVDDAMFQERIDACRACPDYVTAPSSTLYRIVAAGLEEPRMCRRCGCMMLRKARLAGTRCAAGKW